MLKREFFVYIEQAQDCHHHEKGSFPHNSSQAIIASVKATSPLSDCSPLNRNLVTRRQTYSFSMALHPKSRFPWKAPLTPPFPFPYITSAWEKQLGFLGGVGDGELSGVGGGRCYKPTGQPRREIRLHGTSLVVQWLWLHVSNAGNTGLIPAQETKILYAAWWSKKEIRLHVQII